VASSVKPAVRLLRLLVLGATLAMLGAGLRHVDWATMRGALPTSVAFYAIFLLWYLWLPTTDLLAYRLVWPIPLLPSLRAFLLKRIYNREVLQYSGEVYFFGWARRVLSHRPRGELARMIRDQNLIQSVASTVVALALGAGFLLLAGGTRDAAALIQGRWRLALLAVAAASLIGVALVSRGWASMPGWVARRLLAAHLARFAIEQGLLVWLWMVAAPSVALSAWCAYGAVSVVVSRIPLVTNRELLFASMGIGMASRLSVPVEAVAATMLMIAGLSKLVTAGVFVSNWAGRRARARRDHFMALNAFRISKKSGLEKVISPSATRRAPG